MSLEGGCSCGAIRYKLANSPLIVHACHCRDCQRVTGSGFVINIWIEKKFVEASGATPKSIVLRAAPARITKRSSAANAALTYGAAMRSRPAEKPCSFAQGRSTIPTR